MKLNFIVVWIYCFGVIHVSKTLPVDKLLKLLAPTLLYIQTISWVRLRPLMAPVAPNEMSATWNFNINILVTSGARSAVGDTYSKWLISLEAEVGAAALAPSVRLSQ